jgi:hypothetical protein
MYHYAQRWRGTTQLLRFSFERASISFGCRRMAGRTWWWNTESDAKCKEPGHAYQGDARSSIQNQVKLQATTSVFEPVATTEAERKPVTRHVHRQRREHPHLSLHFGSATNVCWYFLLFCLLAGGVNSQRSLVIDVQPEGATEREPLVVFPILRVMESRTQQSMGNETISVEAVPRQTLLGKTSVQSLFGQANFTDLVFMQKGPYRLRFTLNGGIFVDSFPLYVQVS